MSEQSAGAVAGNDRIVAVLDDLITRHRDEGWGVRELAEAVGLSRSTVNRILQGLAERGLARVDTNATYFVGPRLRVLAKVLHDRHPLLRGAPQVMDELSRAADATVMLAVHGPRPDTAFIALLSQQPGPIRYHLEPGMELPLHAGAAGRAILSEVGIDVLTADLTRYSDDTIVDPAMLDEALQIAREAGYVISIGQHIPLGPASPPPCTSHPASSAPCPPLDSATTPPTPTSNASAPSSARLPTPLRTWPGIARPPSVPPTRRAPTQPHSDASSASWRSSSPNPPIPPPASNWPADWAPMKQPQHGSELQR